MKIIKWKGFWTRQDVIKNPDKIFLFGDNYADSKTNYIPKATQAVIRGLPNAVGINTKHDRFTLPSSYMKNEDLEDFKKYLDLKKIQILELIKENSFKSIVISEEGIGTGKAMLNEKAPLLFEYLNNWLEKLNELKK